MHRSAVRSALALLLLAPFTLLVACSSADDAASAGADADAPAAEETAVPTDLTADSELARSVEVTTIATLEAGTGGISVAADGTVLVADFGALLSDPSTAGPNVWAVSPDGATRLFADGFEGASGNEVGPDGSLYQSNIRGNTISRITPEGAHETYATEGIENPVGLVMDSAGVLYVANCGSNSVQRVAPDGTSERFSESDLLSCPNGIVMDDAGNLYIANFNNGAVIKITPDGEASTLTTLGGGNNGHLLHHQGALYVVDRGGHRIVRVSLDGEQVSLAGSGDKGGADGPGPTASFCFPNDIGISPDGTELYVNDVADHASTGAGLSPSRVRVIRLGSH